MYTPLLPCVLIIFKPLSIEKTFKFINGKSESHYLNAKKPINFLWTSFYRRVSKKDVSREATKKRTKRIVKPLRLISGVSESVIENLRAIAKDISNKRKLQGEANKTGAKQIKSSGGVTETKQGINQAKKIQQKSSIPKMQKTQRGNLKQMGKTR